jgi:histidine ammonia-lyase
MSKAPPPVVLTGNDLTIEDIVAVGVGDRTVTMDTAAVERCKSSRAFLESEVRAGKILYGVNTSFGPMCNKIVREDEIVPLQVNLIRSHAAGLGSPLAPYIARGVLVLRLNTLLKGFSGVRIELLEALRDMINSGVAPYIPESGSVGASGDLIHLAHVALALIGEGKVHYKGEWTDARTAFSQAGLKPLVPSFKEGLALINGTAAMTSLAAFASTHRAAASRPCATSASASL